MIGTKVGNEDEVRDEDEQKTSTWGVLVWVLSSKIVGDAQQEEEEELLQQTESVVELRQRQEEMSRRPSRKG